MMSSDSQAMGRIGEVITRTWQTAHKMKLQFGKLEGPTHPAADNFRALRYVAKYTICPALTNGIAHEVGSIEGGKLADLVIWKPAFFGVKPETILKGGLIAWANMGEHGRPERFDSHAAADDVAPSIWGFRQGDPIHLPHLRQPGRARLRLARRPRFAEAPGRRQRLPQRHQSRSSLQRRASEDHRRPRDLYRHRRRRGTPLRAPCRAAVGAAVFLVLVGG